MLFLQYFLNILIYLLPPHPPPPLIPQYQSSKSQRPVWPVFPAELYSQEGGGEGRRGVDRRMPPGPRLGDPYAA
jgi:hypothetical protein